MASAAEASQATGELEAAIARSGIRVFAFDFDMTLVNLHAYNSRVKAAEVPNRWRNDIPYYDELSTIFRTILNAGHKWSIVTFGQPPVIRAYMAALGFTEDQYRVYSPLDQYREQMYNENLSPPENKNELLATCLREARLGDLKNEEMILLDDDRRNVHAARMGGFKGAEVRPGEGISIELFMAYLERANASNR